MTKRNSLTIAIHSLLGCAMMMGAVAANAYDAGDMIFRTGVTSVQPQDSSSNLVVGGNPVADSEAGVKSDQQLGLTFTYMLNSNIGLEVLAATPFEHDINARIGATTLNAGSTKHLPPTVSVVYYPLSADSSFQPYLGLGVNYTKFFSEDVHADLNGFVGSDGNLKLDDSWGLAGQIGVDYQINEAWGLNAAVRYIDIDTTANFNFDNGATISTDVSIDPVVSSLSLSYKF